MALTFTKLFQPALMASTSALIYTVPAAPDTTLLRNGRVRLTNTATSAVAATLNAVPSAGAVAAANEFLAAVSIAPLSSIEVDMPQMAAGDALWGIAGAATSVAIAAMDGILQS